MDELAFKIFKLSSGGFCCSQIMAKLALDYEEKENDDLVRSLNGLCRGIGGSQKTCGVMTGGISVLGLYGGKGNPIEYCNDKFQDMIEEYMGWFEEYFGSTECSDLIGITEFKEGDQSYQIKCGNILEDSYKKLIEIIEDYGFEYGKREYE